MALQQVQRDDTPQPQRMTAEVAKAVIDLWTQQKAGKDAPSVIDVAEGLEIPTDQVEQLLRQVRTQRPANKPKPPYGSGWRLVEENQKESTTAGWRERTGWTCALLVVSYVVAVWTQGTAFTLSLHDNDPVETKWFIGGIDVGLWTGLLSCWKALIRHLRRRL